VGLGCVNMGKIPHNKCQSGAVYINLENLEKLLRGEMGLGNDPLGTRTGNRRTRQKQCLEHGKGRRGTVKKNMGQNWKS